MAGIQIITDSTAYITKEFADKNNVKIVPLSVNFEGQIRDEGFPGEFEEFFDKLKTSKEFPTTSQPSIGAFAKVYEEAIDKGYEIITIVISSKLSGTYNSASVAAEMVAPEKISVIDSQSAASNLRILVEMTLALAKEGKVRAEIVDILNAQKHKMGINLTVDTLDYLKKGGRLSGAQALLGTLLNIRPIIALVEGKLVPVGKVRGKNKAVELMIENIPPEADSISICQIFNREEALEIKDILQNKFKNAAITIDELGPVVGSHLGPRAVGICYKW